MNLKHNRQRNFVKLIMFSVIFFNAINGSAQCNALYPIYEKIRETFKWGYINCKGKILVKPNFQIAFDFEDGVGVVSNEEESNIIDVRGNTTQLKGIRIVTNFSEGVALALNQGQYIYIDKNGKELLRIPILKKINDPLPASKFCDGLASIETTDGWKVINKKGEIVLSKTFDSISNFSYGIAAVEIDGDWTVIDKSGNYLIDLQNETILPPSEGYFVVKVGWDSWNYIDNKGKIVLKIKADYAGNFVENVANINEGNLWGFIDKKGKRVVPLKFKQVTDFSEGLAGVKISNNKYGFINKRGKFVISPILDYIQETFKYGLAYVQKDKYGGYINRKGEWIWKIDLSNEK